MHLANAVTMLSQETKHIVTLAGKMAHIKADAGPHVGQQWHRPVKECILQVLHADAIGLKRLKELLKAAAPLLQEGVHDDLQGL
jgi:hypothetical protein